ncbi:MAG: hypothetical protein Q4B70_08605 [Lachnospiraceae bacterium]|nr:hypothetical protein [Lachnospiraceae bacterium]
MKKIKLVLAGLFILLSAGFFFYTLEQDQKSVPNRIVSGSSITPAVSKGAYYMKMDGSLIVIYRSDNSIYEYTDLNQEVLPASLLEELKSGKYFENEAELYEFLETYTS